MRINGNKKTEMMFKPALFKEVQAVSEILVLGQVRDQAVGSSFGVRDAEKQKTTYIYIYMYTYISGMVHGLG